MLGRVRLGRQRLSGTVQRSLATFTHVATPRKSITVSSDGPRTMYDKIWDDHIVDGTSDGSALLYIDRHLVHEVTSPQAFDGLEAAGRPVRRPDCTLVTVDHNVPTNSREKFADISSFIKLTVMETQCQSVVVSTCSGGSSVRMRFMADTRRLSTILRRS